MNPKPLLESRTIWLNVATLAVAVLTALIGTDIVQQNPQAVAVIQALLAVANLYLRFGTDRPIRRD